MNGTTPALIIQGHQAIISLERPQQANRLEAEDLEVLMQHLARVQKIPDVRVLRLRASGKHFCAGFNLHQLDEASGDGKAFEALTDALEALRPITIAEVQGGVYGGATDLLLCCDFRFGSAAAELQMPAARIGLHLYGGLLRRYVSRLGLNAAKRLILAAEKIPADQMLALGVLTHKVEDPSRLQVEADRFAQGVAEMAPLALAGMKEAMNAIARGEYAPVLVEQNIARCAASRDFNEGVAALTEKRKPVFSGS